MRQLDKTFWIGFLLLMCAGVTFSQTQYRAVTILPPYPSNATIYLTFGLYGAFCIALGYCTRWLIERAR